MKLTPLPDRICARCGLNMGGVGGFTLARDAILVFEGEKALMGEFCTKCVYGHHPNVLATFGLRET